MSQRTTSRRRGRGALAALLTAGALSVGGCSASPSAGRSAGPSRGTASSPATSSTTHSLVATPVAVAYRQAGVGSHVVVLIHGGPGASNLGLFAAFRPLTSRGLRVVYYDQRGVGASPAPADNDYGPDAYIADLEALRVKLGVPRLDLIGHSWGGVVAALYAARYPEHVDAVVEIGGEPLDQVAASKGIDHFQRRVAALQAEHLMPTTIPPSDGNDCRRELDALAPVYAPDPRHPGPYRVTSPVPCSDVTSEGTTDAMAASVARLTQLRHSLASWRGRALIIQGAEDPFGAAFTRADVAQYGGATVTRLVIPHAGHLTWLDDPALVGYVGRYLAAGKSGH